MVVLDRPPGGKWNWQRIFRKTPHPSHRRQQAGWGDWIRFTNSTVIEGQLIVRSPWHARTILSAAARDSAERRALSGKDRLLVQRVPGGFQKVVHLDSVNARIPLLLLTEPGLDHPFAQLSSGSMLAFPFRPPAAIVRDVKGVVAFNNDSAWWKGAYAAMPRSKATGDGVYSFNSGDLHSDAA